MTKMQKVTTIPAIAALMLIGGSVAGYASMAAAQTVDTTTTTSAATQSTQAAAVDPVDAPETQDRQFDQAKGGHVGSNGTKEVVLTGDSAARASAAALAAVPGGTIQRVENDAEGAAFEAHMTKADGSRVTVKFDSNFNVTATESGMGERH